MNGQADKPDSMHDLVGPPRGKRAKGHRRLSTVDRDDWIVRLRDQEYSYTQIAAIVGCSAQTAANAVTRANSLVAVEGVLQLRAHQNAGIAADMAVLQAVLDDPPFVVAPNGSTSAVRNMQVVVQAVDARTRLRARHAKMNGLDMPAVSVHMDADAYQQKIADLVGPIREALAAARAQAAPLELDSSQWQAHDDTGDAERSAEVPADDE